MATVKPFRALRPAAANAADFTSLPYDVMDAAEAREMVAQKPQNFLRVTRAEVDLPPETDPHSPEVYRQAREKLAEYKATLDILASQREDTVQQQTFNIFNFEGWLISRIQRTSYRQYVERKVKQEAQPA